MRGRLRSAIAPIPPVNRTPDELSGNGSAKGNWDIVPAEAGLDPHEYNHRDGDVNVEVPAEGEFFAVLTQVAKRYIYDQRQDRDPEQSYHCFHYSLLRHNKLFVNCLSMNRGRQNYRG
jgi:hypothetical protein